jgi:O-methyltransferase
MRSAFWMTKLQLAAQSAASRFSYGITNYRHPSRAESIETVCRWRSNIETATTPLECVEIVQAVRATANIPGELAEVGVYKGGTAAIILASVPEKHLYLFDTFEGLPINGTGNQPHKAGDYSGSLGQVKKNLSPFADRVTLYRGVFPRETGHAVQELKFSFVHLDTDLYESTLDSLKFFWPRMSPGGVILSHDYYLIDGVARAFHEVFDEKHVPVIPLSGNQCLVVSAS